MSQNEGNDFKCGLVRCSITKHSGKLFDLPPSLLITVYLRGNRPVQYENIMSL